MSQRKFSIVRHADLKKIQEDPINNDLQIIDETQEEDNIVTDIADDLERSDPSTLLAASKSPIRMESNVDRTSSINNFSKEDHLGDPLLAGQNDSFDFDETLISRKMSGTSYVESLPTESMQDEAPPEDKKQEIQLKNMKEEVLNKLNRKMNLDSNLANWNSDRNMSVYAWYKLINKIDDNKLQKICGTDVALYLIWLRYASNFFGIITIMNFGVIVLYVTGTPLSSDKDELGEAL